MPLHIKGYNDGTTIDIALYVDDKFITTDSGADADLDLRELDSVFTITLKRRTPSTFSE